MHLELLNPWAIKEKKTVSGLLSGVMGMFAINELQLPLGISEHFCILQKEVLELIGQFYSQINVDFKRKVFKSQEVL